MNCPHCGVDIDNHPASHCLNVWLASLLDMRLNDFSRNIAAAWEVVDKFQSADIEREFGGNTIIFIEVAGIGWFSAHAPSTSLAISRVAIKACKGE